MGYGGDGHDDEPRRRATTISPTTTDATGSPRARFPTRSIGCGCTRASSRRSPAPDGRTARHRPMWTDDARRRRGRRDPDARRARRGRRARRLVGQRDRRDRPCRRARRSPTATRRSRSRSRHSVVAVSVRDDAGTRRGSGVCVRRVRAPDPHERPARRQRDDGRRDHRRRRRAHARRSSAATRPPISCCSRLDDAGDPEPPSIGDRPRHAAGPATPCGSWARRSPGDRRPG